MSINIISGTNREGSVTLKIANLIVRYYEELGQKVILTDLRKLPQDVFKNDVYFKKPDSIKPLLKDVVEAKGLVIVLPEYNGGFPGMLKYFIDLMKFPESFEKKPVAFIGLSAGKWGALIAVEQLQQIFSYRNSHIFHRKVFLPQITSEINDSGELIQKNTEVRLKNQCSEFIQFIQNLSR